MFKTLKVPQKTANVLEIPYFSVTPSKFNDGAVKYNLSPVSLNKTPYPANPTYDFLKDRIVQDLNEKDVSFDFNIQFQTSTKKMPLEDARANWTSPMIKIARLHIPKQTFDTAKQIDFGTALSYSPWHALEAHRPLGGVSRVRKAVYVALSKLRHQRTGRPNVEPTSWDIS